MESPLRAHASSPAELQERLAAEREGVPLLIWRDSRDEQRIMRLGPETDRVTIGRRAEADVSLDWDHRISRLHAMLERVGGEWTLVDDGLSANGTFLGDERVQGRRRLTDGDLIRLGQTLLAFSDPLAGTAGATAPAGDVSSAARLSEAQRRVVIALCRPFADGAAFATPATNQQIADELYLSLDAVKSHLRALFAKFGLEDLPQNQKRAQLVERAMRTGIVSERDLRS